MPILGRGRILMWEGGSLWIMEATSASSVHTRLNSVHSHHAVQVTLALDGDFELESGVHRIGGRVAAVAADARHAFNARGLFAHVYMEPESVAGRAVANALFAADAVFAAVPPALLGELPEQLTAAFHEPDRDDEVLAGLGRSVIARLAGGVTAPGPDARVQTILNWLAAQLDGPASLAEAADLVGLSKTRIRHLFVEQTGLPFRTYLLWLRLTRGVEAYAAGASLTDAAHEAGFSDSAHFSRTFRRMFGTTAAALRVS